MDINVLFFEVMGKLCSDKRRAKEEEKEVFHRLYEENKERILALAFNFTQNQQDAEDILQESFVKAFRFFSSRRPKGNSNSNLSFWIYRIAVNTAIDFCRRRKRRAELRFDQNQRLPGGRDLIQILDDNHNPENVIHESELGSLIDIYINRLPWRQRSVFILKYYEQLKIKEIAQLLGCSEGSVKRNLFRSVQNLRRNLSLLTKEEVKR